MSELSPVSAPFFHYEKGELYAENVALLQLVQEFGSPLYVYSRAALQSAWSKWEEAVKPYRAMVCYGMKANSNLAILQMFARLGAGFDIVSGGELERCLKAGADPKKIVFSGVGKQDWEIKKGIEAGIFSFNVESISELKNIIKVATELRQKAYISFRVNPDVDAKTHPYISTGLKENKFGIDLAYIEEAAQIASASEFVVLKGLDCHIGSQITEIDPFIHALERLCVLVKKLKAKGHPISHIDLGGGVGIRYQDETVINLNDYVSLAFSVLSQQGLDDVQMVFEPGRSLVGNAGVLLTQVQYIKQTGEYEFAIVDAAMNDLIRPTLYDAYHQIIPLVQKEHIATKVYDVVGPVCETGDWLGKKRPLAIEEKDYLAVVSAGAYGFTMSSQYNSRPRVAEVLVDNDQYHLIRRRETLADLYAQEVML
ncbi:diaminopimelate decarboxylase [Basilea psittacipulmonis]|uniref:Diaminopimelate decarboxylase n=1 Tax=Basilea psittacipulmonis DSM 24701 TaxID=1072685 RepID=A0A077DD55_9BURK|nr:diaminopimelate decarboxylase [Basilea psittacipulmonis]AIL32106.1 diaminopimelate decarboxylase [Basilea psittacipulmonis DSM 24701]